MKSNSQYLKLFTDELLMRVFVSLVKTPKSTKQISKETGISISTVYRKIRKLKEENLIEMSGKIVETGGKSLLYSN